MQAVPPPQPPLPQRWAAAVQQVEAAQQVRSQRAQLFARFCQKRMNIAGMLLLLMRLVVTRSV